jgi:hypothetical protein
VTTFFRITGIEYIDNAEFSGILKSWNSTGTNIQFFNNILGINTRTSHFGNNGTRYCLFCTKSGRPDTDETFIHLFFLCPTVTAWHDEFIENYIVPQQPLDVTDRKKLFFLGIYSGNYNIFLAAAVYHFQFSIWEEKLSKRVPSFITLKTRFLERFTESVNNTKKLQKAGLKINNPLCRYIPRACPPSEG